MRSRARAAPLWLRLAVSFVLVAVAGVALLAGLTLASTNSQVASLSREQERETTVSVVAAVAAAYRQAGGWSGAELDSALVVAREAGVTVAVYDLAHHRIAAEQIGPQAGPGSTTNAGAGSPVTVPVVVAGRTVGRVMFGFQGSGLRPAVAALRTRLIETVGVGAGFAALLALVVALVVARRITRPVAALTRVARARESGDREARAGPLRAPGELEELAMAFDRMADSVSREDELRRALVADVAHELRTPISVLQGSSEALLDGVVEPTPEVISSIHHEVLRLGTRVEDLQALASAEAAGLRMTVESVDLARVAREATASLAPRFEVAQLELVTELEPVTVVGDPARLHQIVTNLLTNVIKFTPAGGGARLEVRPDGRSARLVLTDSGPGIGAEELGRIFDRFWRGEGATSTAGSGIGLAVVAELVRAHRGSIQVDSEPGRGTTFVISLPRL